MCLHPSGVSLVVERDEVESTPSALLDKVLDPLGSLRASGDSWSSELVALGSQRLDVLLEQGDGVGDGDVGSTLGANHIWLIEGEDVLRLGVQSLDLGGERLDSLSSPLHRDEVQLGGCGGELG